MADSTQVVKSRDLKLFYEDWATANAIVANTVAWGTAWGGSWAEVGYSRDGFRVSYQPNFNGVRVDQEMDPLYLVPTGRDLRMATRLAQISAANLKLAWANGTITTVAAGGGARGYDDLDLSSTLSQNYKTVGFDIKNPGDGEALRIVGWKGLVMGASEMAFTAEGDAPAEIAFEAQFFPDTTASNRIMKIRDLTPIAA